MYTYLLGRPQVRGRPLVRQDGVFGRSPAQTPADLAGSTNAVTIFLGLVLPKPTPVLETGSKTNLPKL